MKQLISTQLKIRGREERMNWRRSISLMLVLALLAGVTLMGVGAAKKQVTLTMTLAAPAERWDLLMPLAEEKFEAENPDIDLVLDYEVLPYDETRSKIVTMMAARTSRDLISTDVIWLGEFAEGGFLKDITTEVEAWGRMDEFYDFADAGSKYNGKYYGIWTWTDSRQIWYWKDMLAEAGVKPEELSTWGTYIAACQKLNEYWRPQGVEGCLLIGDSWAADWWYPYLWMLGGAITRPVEMAGYKGEYPAYQGAAGETALQFIVDQVEAGLTPLVGHRWGDRFGARKYVVWLGGTWAIGHVPGWADDPETIRRKVGLIPAFPVPTPGLPTSTMMGGWVLTIPATSEHPDIAWKFMEAIQQPEIIVQMLAKFGYLPTQSTIAEEAEYKAELEGYWGMDWWAKLSSLLPYGHRRPSYAEYPKIAEHIFAAIDEAMRGMKSPKEALTDAARKSAESLGVPQGLWPEEDWFDWYPPQVIGE
jgi:multiple sugar transport system substrate-binding protein